MVRLTAPLDRPKLLTGELVLKQTTVNAQKFKNSFHLFTYNISYQTFKSQKACQNSKQERP